jgi:TonB family protein
MRNLLFASLILLLLASVVGIFGIPFAVAKSYDAGTEDGAEFIPAKGVNCPCPQLPSELKENGMQCCCEVRFQIDDRGDSKVKIVRSSGSDEIDDITLRAVRKWKFRPAMLDGKPVASTRRLKVEYEVD